MSLTDRELLRAFRTAPAPEPFQPLLDRYLPFVYAAACRQCATSDEAAQVAKAVFLALARRSGQIKRRTVLAQWLFDATRLAARKAARARAAGDPIAPRVAMAAIEGDTWSRLAPLVDPCLSRLAPKHRRAVLLRYLLGWQLGDVAAALRVRPRRAEKRVASGLRRFLRLLRKRKLLIDADALTAALAENLRATTLPVALESELLAAAPECVRRRPSLALARSTLWAITRAKWKARLKMAGAALGGVVVFVALIAGCLALLWHTGRLLPWLIQFGARRQIKDVPELAEPAKPWPANPEAPLASAAGVATRAQLYQTTNIWQAHLSFSQTQWAALEPKRIPAVRRLMEKDGTINLRNPNARRSGLAGSLGWEYEWTHAALEFSGVVFSNVACRYRGNGTYLNSLYGPKRPFKVDLNKFEKGQSLGTVRTLNFGNLVVDSSFMSDAMGYELFRDAGLPAPRTAYAWLTLSVEGKFDRKPIGLYLLLEDLDSRFADEQLGSKKSAILKPVTYDLFKDLGPDWSAYDRIYDPKTKLTADQQQRVIDFARLLTHANDDEFARRVGEFLDLDEFAGFLAGLVLLSSYDGFLSNGQNFYVYLDARSNKFGFIPWDLDHAWGGFPFVGTPETREQASIWRPWTSRNRLLERVMNVEEFRSVYRARLEKFMDDLFVPERLMRRMDEIAGIIQGPVRAESSFRARRLAQAVSTNWLERPTGKQQQDGPAGPVHQIKRFIINRSASVREQLDGKSQGVVLGGFKPQ